MLGLIFLGIIVITAFNNWNENWESPWTWVSMWFQVMIMFTIMIYCMEGGRGK